MHKNSKNLMILFAVTVLVSLTVGIASAAPVTQNINYQGKLTDAAGNPLTGTYSVMFRLYDVSTGGTALVTDTHTVQASKGLFTTQITFDSGYFIGDARWVGITVGSDAEMTPRQEIRPVPYALSLRPGAWITSSDFSSTLNLQNKGGGKALNASTTGQWSDGVVVSTSGQYSTGVSAYTAGTSSTGVSAYTAGQYSPGVRASTAGPNSYGMIADTTNTSSTGVYAHTSGQYSDGVHTDTRGPNSQGVYASTSGIGSDGVYASTSGTGSYGVFARTGGGSSDGVYAYTTGPISSGVRAYTTGPSSFGMIAYTTNTSSTGVHATTTGTGSPAIYGDSAQDVGVYGKGKEGGYFTTNQGGTSWQDLRAGVKVSTTYAFNPGMNSKTTGYSSNGMRALTTGDWSNGVDVTTSGANSDGIEARTTGMASDAVAATTEGQFSGAVSAKTSGENSVAVWAQTDGDSSDAVVVYAKGLSSKALYAYSDQSPAIWAETGRGDNKYGVQTPNIIRALNYETGSSDIAEYIPVTGEVSPGTILVIGPDGKLQPSTSAYDTGVAGIVSTAPGVSLGAKEGGNPGEQLIAVAGRVPCKVDTSNGPIHPRDLLTTSDNPGYAMKAKPTMINGRGFYPDGTILGKAMGSLESGTGTIEVLVTLQ